MRRIWIAASLTIFIFASAIAADGEIAPDFTLSTPNGTQVNLDAVVEGQTTVLFFWATWCPYCKALMPQLQSIRLEYGDAVEILAINIKEDGDPVEFITKAGYDFTLLPDGDAVAEAYDVFGTPGIFIVDDERLIRFNLFDLPKIEPPETANRSGHLARAAYRAPYWGAEIRKGIDEVLSN